ncbi:MAG TPA: TatD family hydrolase [Flavobacterium sp.]|nr:TatD family hydrolase [Flavobacterium sp.]
MFFNLHTHKSGSDPEVVELVNQYPQELASPSSGKDPRVDATIPFYSIGIHPWHIVENRVSEDLGIIKSKLGEQNCLAIGECGLDKRIEIPFDLQVGVFEKQLALAERYQKPVVIHCVAAFSEVMEIKKRLKISVPMIIHGFSKNEQTAKQLLDHGFYLSFGKYLLRNPELESVFKSVPDDRFFLETDTIEESIRDVYNLAAKYRSTDLQTLQNTIKQNFSSVFNRTNLII